ncbi:acyl-CoA thioesterase [Celeribacter indicus]|uniref:Thioesterase-like protein n=1 Tax=Celeribacter indicus TaxID=1208324 RepID=A0A0B5E1V3_9RHOB|nr:thioesterase family protein [Celeribacter indicus]AJE49209.1 thioesterase-like protein [Celeribacter indicus]SDX51659.1 acyl-CoA thioester hydrolase [Celeribacter indicus]
MSSTGDRGGFSETHRGHVLHWERDENEHWNGRYYTGAFQRASEVAAVLLAHAPPGGAMTHARHIRFFRELRGGEPMVIETARLPEPVGAYGLIHRMRHSVSGRLAAVSFEAPGFDVAAIPVASEPELATLGPRGLPAGAPEVVDGADLLSGGRAVVSRLDIVRPGDLDAQGRIRADVMHGYLNEGSPHLWAHGGVVVADLYARRLGRAMVELCFGYHASAPVGSLVRLVSWFERFEDKRVVMRHQLETAQGGEVLATMASLVLIIDLEARRAVPVPEFIMTAYRARMSA